MPYALDVASLRWETIRELARSAWQAGVEAEMIATWKRNGHPCGDEHEQPFFDTWFDGAYAPVAPSEYIDEPASLDAAEWGWDMCRSISYGLPMPDPDDYEKRDNSESG
jgi:hypothetical protein